MKYTEIASRLTGFSTPLFGVSWQPPVADAHVARRVLTFLEDRRVLYVPSDVEVRRHCIISVLEIRRFLTELLSAGGVAKELADHLRAMRSACRKFLMTVGADGSDDGLWTPNRYQDVPGLHDWSLNQALGELRGVFGVHVAHLASSYGIDVENDFCVHSAPANGRQLSSYRRATVTGPSRQRSSHINPRRSRSDLARSRR